MPVTIRPYTWNLWGIAGATLSIAIVVVLFACGGATSLGDDRPNVIIVLTDDQGYGDMSAHGNPILRTPHLDKLHDESIRLTDFHVAPVCTPTRGELMTGMYSMRNKASMVPAGRNLMRRDIQTMPEIFGEAGYATGLFGKWHLGHTYPHRPMDRGFQRVVWHKGWGLASEVEYDNDLHYTRYFDEEEEKYSDRFCANLWFDEAMAWMEERAAAGEPFFTYIALNTPHYPFDAIRRDFFPYRNAVDDPLLAHFYGLIVNIDDNMARLDAWMAETGLRENTILVFLNDNGTAMGETVFNAGMRGKKGDPYEGGHRAICFLRWPNGGLGESRAIDYPSHVTDLLPTLGNLAGISVPEPSERDGASLKPLLVDAGAEGPDRKIIVHYGGRHRPAKYSDSSVLWNEWRLVGDSELYNIADDPGQTTNVADANPEVLEAMRAHFEEYWTEVGPKVDPVEPLLIRSETDTATEITSNSWIEVDCDNRTRVAEACGPGRGGPWQLEVEADGRYAVELSRWPFFLERDMTLKGPATTIGGVPISQGEPLLIASAALVIDDGDIASAKSANGATSVRFEVDLTAGLHRLQGWFRDSSGRDLVGAYYARIGRI